MVSSQKQSFNEAFSEHRTGLFYQIFKEIAQPVLVIDPDEASIIASNDAASDLFGYSREQLQGVSLDQIRPDSLGETEARKSLLHSPLEDRPPRTVKKQVRDSVGNVFWVDLECQSLSVDDQQYVLLTVQEHGEKSEPKHDRRAYKTAVENAGHAIYWTDVDGTIEYANPAFEKITGYDREAVRGKTPHIFNSGAMSEEYYRDLWTTVLSGETFEAEVSNESADGDRLVLSQTIAPIKGSAGEIERFVAVNRDITDRKEREERLEAEKERGERLQQRLSVMNRILRHDIRSSVNIIRGNAKLAGQADRRLDGALDTILEEADRLQRIAESVRHVQDVLEENEVPNNVLDLSTRVRTKVLVLKNESQSVDFHVDLPDRALVKAREKFDLALDHLLQNAIEHSDRDEPTIEVSICETETKDLELRIADDGPGIPDGELRPLESGRETPLEHTSGLGLWLAKWIIKVSGGELSFEENAPRGTVVRIRLESATAF